MKKLLLALAFTLTTSFSWAQTVTLPATLQETMGAMGKNLKTISLQFSDAALNESSAAAAASLVLLIVHAQTTLPPKVLTLDAADQPAMIEKYNAMMSQTSVVAVKILAALQAGKNSEVAGLLKDLKAVQAAGHAEFME